VTTGACGGVGLLACGGAGLLDDCGGVGRFACGGVGRLGCGGVGRLACGGVGRLDCADAPFGCDLLEVGGRLIGLDFLLAVGSTSGTGFWLDIGLDLLSGLAFGNTPCLSMAPGRGSDRSPGMERVPPLPGLSGFCMEVAPALGLSGFLAGN